MYACDGASVRVPSPGTAMPDILHIDNKDIELSHIRLRRGMGGDIRVEGQDGHARLLIHRAVDHRACVLRAPEAVLRAEDGRDVYAPLNERVQYVFSVGQRLARGVQAKGSVHVRFPRLRRLVADDAGVVGKQGHPLSLQQGQVFLKLLVSEQYIALGSHAASAYQAE